MRGRRRFPRLGSIVSVDWFDITSTINATLSEAAPAKCTTTGHLVKKTDAFIVIATSIFDEPGPEISGDFIAIPVGVVCSIRRL